MKGWRYFTNIFGDQSIQNSGSKFEPISCEDQPGEDVSLLKNSVILQSHDQRNGKRRFSKLNEMIDSDDVTVTQENSTKNKSLVETSSYFEYQPSALEDNLIPDLSPQCPSKICPDSSSTCTCSQNKHVANQQKLSGSSHGHKSNFSSILSRNGNDTTDCFVDYGINWDDPELEDKMAGDWGVMGDDWGMGGDCEDDDFHEVRKPLCPSLNKGLCPSLNNHINSKISFIQWPKCSFNIRPPLIAKTSSLAEKNLIEFD